jgi:CubicO group peptidase (beta-lactamase class C family)
MSDNSHVALAKSSAPSRSAPRSAETRRTSSRVIYVLCIGATALLLLGGCDRISRVSGVPANFASHQLCSAVFVGGLDPTEYYREAIAPKLGAAGNLVHYDVDRERREVRVSLAGLVHSRAVDEGPFGCRVIHPGVGFTVVHDEENEATAAPPVPIAGSDPVEPKNAALSEALDHAFIEPESAPHRYTKAVVVLHHGHIVGERYASGITAATPLPGWSMTKSVTNALLGILVREGKLDMYKPAPIAEWSSPGDPRRQITSDQLLRMVSGLRCGQSLDFGWWTIFDADAQMEYDMADEAAFAARAGLRAPPGSEWQYTNCNFALLSRIIRNAAGGGPEAAREFIEHELFAPLGLEHATLEFDSAGTPLGSIQLWASARDWARFGLLYLHDGVSTNEQRILPEGWVDYSARLTPQSDAHGYGAGFWTQRGNSSAGRARVASGMPADSFMARGSQGQYTIIVPSEDLVIVRLGWSYTPDDDSAAAERLTREVIAALHADQRTQ